MTYELNLRCYYTQRSKYASFFGINFFHKWESEEKKLICLNVKYLNCTLTDNWRPLETCFSWKLKRYAPKTNHDLSCNLKCYKSILFHCLKIFLYPRISLWSVLSFIRRSEKRGRSKSVSSTNNSIDSKLHITFFLIHHLNNEF